MKDTEWSGLFKVPNEEIIKELRIQLGKTNSFVEELKNDIEVLSNYKKEYIYNLENKVKNIEKKLEQSRKECNKVVSHNVRMQKELFKIYKDYGKNNI